jgi:acetyl-CoA carboxylase carboxyl transferase subunit alpha
MMLEHAIYSVISPEGCASILWRSASHAADAAAALRITAQDMLQLGIIDSIIQEPLGGAHRDRERMINSVGATISHALAELTPIDSKELISQRHAKYLNIGKKGLS